MGFAKPDNTGARIWQCDICGSTWAAPGGECAECVQTERDRYKIALGVVYKALSKSEAKALFDAGLRKLGIDPESL